ncbi:hypothetical protein TrCOL_g11729 [Triparma columacea]|uniref:Uncharacterized protein n=1 Tax=Triparma columacea TaxID=722753 RepID=A0A9W7G9Z9_9STRA|nr:hypothetical protein TrCOL_g11729 [Triparma columacea]
MNVKYTVITYDKVSDTFSISEDDDDNASEDNKEEEEVEELCHDLFKDFAPTRKNERAEKSNEKSNEIPTGATSTERQEALQELASYVVLCGGTRNLLDGWSARRYSSGAWYCVSKEGESFTSRAKVARWFKLPGAPKVEQSRKRKLTPYDALEELASYVVLCGGERDLLEGWSARQDTSKIWHYESKTGTRFHSRPKIARWLELPGAPMLVQRTSKNIASVQQQQQSVRRLSQVSKKRKR